MRIGLLSDTHGFLDDAIFAHFENCGEIWHAGDIGSADVLDRVNSFRRARMVFGNIDGPELRSRLSEDLQWTIENLEVYMTHIGGYPGRYNLRARQELARRKPDLFVCGHSHVLKVMRDTSLGLLHMNPGARGHSGWHSRRTIMRFVVEADNIRNIEALDLGLRGRNQPGTTEPSKLPRIASIHGAVIVFNASSTDRKHGLVTALFSTSRLS